MQYDRSIDRANSRSETIDEDGQPVGQLTSSRSELPRSMRCRAIGNVDLSDTSAEMSLVLFAKPADAILGQNSPNKKPQEILTNELLDRQRD